MPRTTVVLVAPKGTTESLVRSITDAIAGVSLEPFEDVESAARRCTAGDVGLVLVSLRRDNSTEVPLNWLGGDCRATLPVIALMEQHDPDRRLQLLDRGVVDCLTLPFDRPRLACLIDVLTVRARYAVTIPAAKPAAADGDDEAHVDGFCFQFPQLRKLLRQVRAVAPLDTTLLLTGETGAGKTHLARVIHALSARKAKPFLVVHCATLASTLFESELFGHVRGAFTHAERDREGKLKAVQDGTLLLDEVDCVPLEAQAKLLRVVEERVFEPVGSNKSETFRARLIVASNRSLEDAVAAGEFRADLYYRLSVVSFFLPPLRSHPELIPQLAEKFLAEARVRDGRNCRRFAPAALRALQSYAWPGNVRELRNAVDGAIALTTGSEIGLEDLPEKVRRGVAAPSVSWAPGGNHLAQARMAAEAQELRESLRRHANNRTVAARELGISRVALYRKLHRYGLI